jgi:ubiquinone/menaquinone biosynthesis C-methylase UbiE
MSLPLALYVHGSTDEREVARLVAQAAFVATFSLVDFDAPATCRVLDLGTGVGAMAAELARRYPGVALTGVDLSETQLARAKALHPMAHYVLGNAERLPFADASFDRVHATWVLEHVENPVRVLEEARRVLAKGGMAHVTEVNNETLRVDPPLPELTETFDALNAAQIAAGGHPFIGKALARLARDAGFSRVETREVVLLGDDAHPEMREALYEEFAGICESLDEALPTHAIARARKAASLLRSRGQGTSLEFRPVVLRAFGDTD